MGCVHVQGVRCLIDLVSGSETLSSVGLKAYRDKHLLQH